MSKKIRLLIPLLAILTLSLLMAACSGGNTGSGTTDSTTSDGAVSTTTIKIGATATPHAEILAQVKETLAAEGIALEVQEFSEYTLLNPALTDKQIDANFFQHQPYLDDYNTKNGATLVSLGTVHYEPLGIYAGKTKALADLADGAKIAVPNDPTNEARALLLLQDNGLIKLKEGAGVAATKTDIAENAKNFEIVEIDASQTPNTLPDVDIAVINGNYALEAGLNVTDALAKEEQDSLAAKTYANIIAVRAEDKEKPELQSLIKALQSDAVKKYIEDTYKGAVLPYFSTN